MCHDCLKRIFTMSVSDPAHMPPKCCTADHIPLKHVEKLFDTKFKIKWNRKFQEYTTKNKLYCPTKNCDTWISPRDIKVSSSKGSESPRKYGKCPRCKTLVCALCNCKWHSSRECPKDEETKRFAEMAKAEGWQRCYNCSATVELKEGCNHMTCRCTAEFCMICGAQWRTCECPWFTYAAVENDRLNHLNAAEAREEAARNNRPQDQVRAYQEIEQRQWEVQLDAIMARRMGGLDIANRNPHLYRVHNNDDLPAGANIFGIGNAGRHFLNDHFVHHRPPNILDDGGGVQAAAAAAAVDRLATEIRDNNRTDAAFRPPLQPRPPSPRRTRQGHGGLGRTNTRAASSSSRPGGGERRSSDRGPRSPGVDNEGRRSSALAGLTRTSSRGRVDAWRRYVSGDAGAAPA